MILPGSTLGVLGGGQLGQMFVLRARSMGYRTVVLDPDPQAPAGAAADMHICASFTDTAALHQLGTQCDAITTEFENIPAAVLASLAQQTTVHPRASAVAIAQDRVAEKQFFRACGLGTADFAAIASLADIAAAIQSVSTNAILKTNRLGYDGKGQARVQSAEEIAAAFASFGGVPCILEARIALQREISVVVARGADGTTRAFPPAENVHVDGILYTSTVPARVDAAIAAEAIRAAEQIATQLEYVGVLGVEFFIADGGELLVNEMAPRTHNSGHWTQDACTVDQFEQQVRALTGLPLGAPRVLSCSSMVNILGDVWDDGVPQWDHALAMPGVRLHLYGKAEPRTGRKMGHLNCLAASTDESIVLAQSALAALRH